MKKLTNCMILMLLFLNGMGARAAVGSNVIRVVGGDLSLVPAYEAAGDKWLDASGKTINTAYSDGMITYLRDVAGWTSVRVRLLVDPSQDDYVATCQDLDYVKQLGKRVKDAGMYFLLDIFYSDTWTDVSKQWIPKSWNYSRSTATATLAAKVKSYTTEVLNTLTAYGAQPDYVQVGNEVSYGMLWDSASGANTSNAFYTSGTYNNYSTQITRFATLLKAAAEGVRAATNGSKMKIVLHSERTYYNTQTANFYTWVEQAGFTDYDVIGLSYYPVWHGAMNKLTATLSSLQSSFPNKEIQIVETGYHNTTPSNQTYDTSSTWPYTSAGQASFLSDLTTTLNSYTNVTGLYYWQAEECGNGANSSGVSQVMDSWDNRGFWECSWKSGSHKLNGSAALMTLQNFNHTALGESGGGNEEEYTVTDISDQFTNLDFEDCTWNDGGWYDDCPGWTINWEIGWSDNPWPKAADQWHSSLCDGVLLSAWNAASNALVAGNVLSQSLDNLPAGKYTVTAAVHCDYDGLYLFANDNQTKVTATSEWGTAYNTTVETELTAAGTLTIGLKLPSAVSTSSEINLYLDNFTVTQTLSSGSGSGEGGETGQTVTTGEVVYQENDASTASDWVALSSSSMSVARATSPVSSSLSARSTGVTTTSTTALRSAYLPFSAATALANNQTWAVESDIYLPYTETTNTGTTSYEYFQIYGSNNATPANGAVADANALFTLLSTSPKSASGNTYSVKVGATELSSSVTLVPNAWYHVKVVGSATSVDTVLITKGTTEAYKSVTSKAVSAGYPAGLQVTLPRCKNKGTAVAYFDNETLTYFTTTVVEEADENDYTSHIGDYGFEESVHFEWDNGSWTTGDEVWLWDYAEEGTSPYTVTTNEWAANPTNLCTLWTENPVTASGHIFCQTVKDLPNGTYTLTVELCDEKGNLYLFGGDQETAAGEGSTSWNSVNTLTLTGIEVTDGTLQIGLGVDGTLNTNVSGYVDNFHLTLTALSENQDKTLTYTHEGITYTYNTGTKVAYVSGYTAADLPTEAEGQVLLGEFTVDGVTYYPSYIGEWALQAYPLYWLDVPSSITVVGKGALYGSNLSNVTFYTNDYLSIYDYAFTGWEDGLDDGNLGTKGSPLYNVTIYAESMDHVTVSDKAFCPDDIDEATLWVVKGLQGEAAYTGIGFLHVYPMGVTVGDVNDDDQVTIADVTALVNIILGKGGSYIEYAADVNGDGQITIADVTALVNKILGKASL
ncbi:MAG: glycosyl hydrolase 53 family protein [Prevotella sp.]|nr:glycosyl hydrolase 53 family protein [Bacteroidaceae bacterium]MBR1505665.1 glycosyl hydrolase 53 family protein [Prevotella sp.]